LNVMFLSHARASAAHGRKIDPPKMS